MKLSEKTVGLPAVVRLAVLHDGFGQARHYNHVRGTMTRTYRPRILEELARHGLKPLADTPPGLLRDAVRDLYKHEIKRLRASLIAGLIEKRDYAGHVIELRKKYPILSLPTELWMNPP